MNRRLVFPGIRLRSALTAIAIAVLGLGARPAEAHEMRPAYLQLKQTSVDNYQVLWKVPALGPDQRLSLHVVFPPDSTSPEDTAGTRFTGDAYVERSVVSRPGGLEGGVIRIEGLSATFTDVLVRLERLNGDTVVARLTPAAPTFVIPSTPGRWQIVNSYLMLGLEHILAGVDHLLFVLALMLIVNGWKRLIGTITAFTVAHSLTLAAASLGWVRVPGPPVEAVIALSIVFVATEIVHVRQGRPSLTAQRPWIVAFTFGLLHGLGFAGALNAIGLPPNAIPLSLLFFNLGVELGQLVFVGTVLCALAGAQKLGLVLPARLQWLPPYAIGSVAMFWVLERVAGF